MHEFPRVADAVSTLPYRYCYTAGGEAETGKWFHTTIKRDMQTGVTETRNYGKQCEVGEPVFVARESARAEDDGWLMVLVYDADRDTTDFVILDATDITGDPVATVELPQRVPHGFHGNWVSD